VGEAPSTWADWFTQQKRWSYGIWQIYLTPELRAGIRHNFKHFRTGLGFLLHDVAKPVEFVWLLLFGLLAVAHLLGGGMPVGGSWVVLGMWVGPLVTLMPMQLWLRRYFATEHERCRFGLRTVALHVATGPIFFAAGFTALLRRPLAYSCTAKSRFKSSDLFSTFRLHLWWAAATGMALGCAMWADRGPLSMRFALAFVLATSLVAPLAYWTARIRENFGRFRANRGRQVDIAAAVE